ncbi:MAG: DUF4442 domain-containing protein [Bdellovibrionaceae bacterium]|nr:DUF4442 domain-containing protein [Pseudobdellovibrionaceae bacterium]
MGTITMRAFGLVKIPLLFACSPRVLELSNDVCRVEIPFRKVVKNHLGSMYFGTLAIGADTCVGMLAMEHIRWSQREISLIFKDFKAEFLKRAQGPTIFICEQGPEIEELIQSVIASGERQHRTIMARAEVHGETVATFELTLSLKMIK